MQYRLIEGRLTPQGPRISLAPRRSGLPLVHEQEDDADDLANLADLVIGNDEEQH